MTLCLHPTCKGCHWEQLPMPLGGHSLTLSVMPHSAAFRELCCCPRHQHPASPRQCNPARMATKTHSPNPTTITTPPSSMKSTTITSTTRENTSTTRKKHISYRKETSFVETGGSSGPERRNHISDPKETKKRVFLVLQTHSKVTKK